MNGMEERGQYYISQTCGWQRFEARKVVFSSECLKIFAAGCNIVFGIICHYEHNFDVFREKKHCYNNLHFWLVLQHKTVIY